MKILIVVLGLAAVGAWYLYNQAKESKVVSQTQNKAVQYTESLQKDVKKAQDAAGTAGTLIKKTAADVEKAVR